MIIFLNDKFIEAAKATISPFDKGFLLGDGLFETIRVYGGHPFRLDDHLDRLRHSLELAHFPIPISKPRLKAVLFKLIQLNQLNEAFIRITVSRGKSEPVWQYRAKNTQPTIMVMALPFKPYPESFYQHGIKAVTMVGSYLPRIGTTVLKSTSFQGNLLAKQIAENAGAQEVIFLTEDDQLIEGSISNLFLIKDKCLITPSVNKILPGITRRMVLSLANDLGIQTIETYPTLDDLRKADEAFLTNSLMEVMPLTSVNNSPIGSGRPGSVTKKLIIAYRQKVKQELNL
jgi:branched-chain amino acid aminotransferase